MDAAELFAAFRPVFSNLTNLVEQQSKPLLAHYTSLEALEKIIKNETILFSNPLFMNDTQEFGFKMVEGSNIISEAFNRDSVKRAAGEDIILAILNSFRAQYIEYEQKHALDLFVFCFSEHDSKNNDGVLSMWRAYGGNGSGAALVINSDFVTLQDGSPLLIAKVDYKSDGERRVWLSTMVNQAIKILLTGAVPDVLLTHYAAYIFQLLKGYSVLSKHVGFKEEAEWRVVYFPERDTAGLFTENRSYIVGKNGIEPKLKFPIRPLKIENDAKWNIGSITDRVIVGPTQSSTLATQSIKKMLEAIDREAVSEGRLAHKLADKVIASTIPYRTT